MAKGKLSRSHILGDVCFRSPDESEEIAFRSDGVRLKRFTGTSRWKKVGQWDAISSSPWKTLRRLGWTEHQLDEDGSTIR